MGALSTPRATIVSRFGGSGSISGNVDNDAGANAERDLMLYDRFGGALIRKTRSGADGNYVFTDLKVGLVVDVVCRDDDAGTQYNDLIQSRVTVS